MRHSMIVTMTAGLAGLCLSASTLAAPSPLTPATPLTAIGEVVSVINGHTYEIALEDKPPFERIRGLADGHEDRSKHLDRFFNGYRKIVRVAVANMDTRQSKHPSPDRNAQAARRTTEKMRRVLVDERVEARCHGWAEDGALKCNIQMSLYKPVRSIKADIGYALLNSEASPYLTDHGKNPYHDQEYRDLLKLNKSMMTGEW